MAARDENETAQHVLIDDAQRLVGEREKMRNAAKIARHQRDVGSLNGHVASERAHRDAQIAGRERGRVVHAVADHHNFAAVSLQLVHRFLLLLRQTIGLELRHADMFGDRFGDGAAISGQHHQMIDTALAKIQR